MRPRASIIIVTYGQRTLTEQCLRSLERSLGPKLGREFELVLVDNDSPDDTPGMLREWSDRAVVELLPENRDFAGGCNTGARLARGEALIFLNNDTEVPPGALEALTEQALEPGVSIAGCRLHFPNGTVQHAGVAFLRNRWLNGAAMPQHVFHHLSPELPAAQAVYECDAVTAACMAVRRTTFADAGGFDEGFVNGLEDIDLCLRIRTRGERVVYRGDVVVIHHEGASRGRGQQLVATPTRLATMRHNDERFCGRWAALLDQDDAHARSVWGAALEDAAPLRDLADSDCVVMGEPSGPGPGGAEARALLAGLSLAGHAPAAVDHAPLTVISPAAGDGETALARRRILAGSLPWILVPAGAKDHLSVPASHVIRIGRLPTATPLHGAQEIWVTCPALADALVDDGGNRRDIRIVPPYVPRMHAGAGGNGIVVLLPTHDRSRARILVEMLAGRTAPAALTVIPTVRVRGLESELADRLPGTQLMGPLEDESAFRRLISDADLLIVDDDDPFNRRALSAAMSGTSTLVAGPDGPARWLLGDEAVLDRDRPLEALRTGLTSEVPRVEWRRRAAPCGEPVALSAPALV